MLGAFNLHSSLWIRSNIEFIIWKNGSFRVLKPIYKRKIIDDEKSARRTYVIC